MNGQRGGSKKRKGDATLDAEKSLYGSFVNAANAVSQLYTAAVQQNKRAEEQGARQALERVAQFVVKEYGNAPAVPTAVLMEVLRQELQAAQGSTTAIQLPFPVPLLPTAGALGSDSSDAHHSDDEHLMSAEQPPAASFRRSGSGHHISPPKARSGGAVTQLPMLFQQQQQQQVQHQQQQQLMLQHQHQLMVQYQQQQQQQQATSGFMSGLSGQLPIQ